MKNFKLFAFVASAVLLVSTFTVFGALTNSRAIVSHNQHTVDLAGVAQLPFGNDVGGRYKFGTTSTLSDRQFGGNTIELSPITIPGYDNAVLVNITNTNYTNDDLLGISWIKFTDLAEAVDTGGLAGVPNVLYKTNNYGSCDWWSLTSLPPEVSQAGGLLINMPVPEVSLDGSEITFYFGNGIFLDSPVVCDSNFLRQFVVVWNSI